MWALISVTWTKIMNLEYLTFTWFNFFLIFSFCSVSICSNFLFYNIHILIWIYIVFVHVFVYEYYCFFISNIIHFICFITFVFFTYHFVDVNDSNYKEKIQIIIVMGNNIILELYFIFFFKILYNFQGK